MPPCCTAFPWSLGWLAAVLAWQMLGSLEQPSEEGKAEVYLFHWFDFVLKQDQFSHISDPITICNCRVSSCFFSVWEEWRNMTLFSAKVLCKHLCERRGTTNHDYTFKHWPVFSSAAPCAPVINPQAPNAATGSSLRVCWSLFSDDTVECYQLSYQPVSNERHSDGQAGKEAGAQGTPQPSTGKTSWCQIASACLVHCLPPKLSYLPPPSALSLFPCQVCRAASCSRTHHRGKDRMWQQQGQQEWEGGSGWSHEDFWRVGTALEHMLHHVFLNHSIFKEQTIISSALQLKPPDDFTAYLRANNSL